MKYEIRATKRFERDFRRLTKEMKVRIDSAIRGLQENPYLGKFLHGDLKGKRSLRIGDYRVIYAVDEESRTIALIAAGHRKGVY